MTQAEQEASAGVVAWLNALADSTVNQPRQPGPAALLPSGDQAPTLTGDRA